MAFTPGSYSAPGGTTFTFPELISYTQTQDFDYLSAAVSQTIDVDDIIVADMDFANLFVNDGASSVTINTENLAEAILNTTKPAPSKNLKAHLDDRLQEQFVAVGLEDDDFPSGSVANGDSYPKLYRDADAATAGGEEGENNVKDSFITAVDTKLTSEVKQVLFAQLVKMDARITELGISEYAWDATKIAKFELVATVQLDTTLTPVLPAGTSLAGVAVGQTMTVKSPRRTYLIRINNTSEEEVAAQVDVSGNSLAPVGTTTTPPSGN